MTVEKLKKQTSRDSRTRSVRKCLGIFLTNLIIGIPNKILCTLFRLGRDFVLRALSSARICLSKKRCFIISWLPANHKGITNFITYNKIGTFIIFNRACPQQYWLQMKLISIYQNVPSSNSNENAIACISIFLW